MQSARAPCNGEGPRRSFGGVRSPRPLVAIANPAAGRGRAARLIPRFRDALAARGITTLHLTSRAGEERDIAEAATRDGAGTVLALGGDGTWGNVARGILAGGGGARLALAAAGTGNDLAFASGIPAHDIDAAIAAALAPNERRIDVGVADGVHFVNCLGFGFDAEVVRAVGGTTWARGHAVYLATAVRQLFAFRTLHARVTVGDDDTLAERRHLMLVVSNGARFGGGFLIAPDARNDDGMLDLVRVGDATPWRRAVLLSGASRGRHVHAPEVSLARATSISLDFEAPPIFQADGELHLASSAHVAVNCLAGALRLAVPR